MFGRFMVPGRGAGLVGREVERENCEVGERSVT